MHAVVLGRPSTDTAVYGQKVGMREVKTYLDVMLKTMKNEEITSKDAPTEFKEMNRYLYLVIKLASRCSCLLINHRPIQLYLCIHKKIYSAAD